MKENYDKTKSSDKFILNNNPRYQDQLNRLKFFSGYNNINNPYSMNVEPKNEMNILPNQTQTSEQKQRQLSSDLKYKALCFVIVMLLFLGVISFLLIYCLKQKNSKLLIELTFYNKTGNAKIMNPNFSYDIQGLQTNKENKTNLRSMIDNNEIEIKTIEINSTVSNFSSMFEDCTDLIKINFINMKASKIKEMSNTFKGCTNLEIIDFNTLDTSKVTSMENMFKGCTNLSDLKGFENLDTSKLENINEMFVDCTHLIFVNFPSLDFSRIKQKNNIFQNNTSLQYVDLRNSININISEIYEMFKDGFCNNKSDTKIIINDEDFSNQNETIKDCLINSTELEMTCKKGSNEECKECSSNINTSLDCRECNEGYFLTNSAIFTKKRCRKCDECNNNKCYDDENGKISCYPEETETYFNTDNEEKDTDIYDIYSSSDDSTEGLSMRYLLSIELPSTKFISKAELKTTDFSPKELITQNLDSLVLPKNELTELQTDISHIQNNDLLTKDLSSNKIAKKDLSSNELSKKDKKE